MLFSFHHNLRSQAQQITKNGRIYLTGYIRTLIILGYIIESQDIGIYTIIYQDIRMYLTGRGLAIELAFHSILAGHY